MTVFEQGRLYRHLKYGYVVCTLKVENVAKFKTVQRDEFNCATEVSALDGSDEVVDLDIDLLQSHIDRVRSQEDKLRTEYNRQRQYREAIVEHCDYWMAQLEEENSRETLTELAADGTVKAQYVRQPDNWNPSVVTEPRDIGEHVQQKGFRL